MADSLTNPLVQFENLIQNGGIDSCYESFLKDRAMLDGRFATEANDVFTFSEVDEYGDVYLVTETFKGKLNKKFRTAYRQSTQTLSDQLNAIVSSVDLNTRIMAHLDTLVYLHRQVPTLIIHNANNTVNEWVLRLIKFLQDKFTSLNISHPAFKLLNDLPSQDEEENHFKLIPKYLPRLPDLYSNLLQKGFIDSTTTLETFERIFSDLPIEENERMQWTKVALRNKEVSKTSIIHLFKTLIKNGFFALEIGDEYLKEAIPKVAVIKFNNQIKEIRNIHQSFDNYKTAKKSSGDYKEIDEIIFLLKG